MFCTDLLDEVEKKHDDNWWPLRQIEGVLVAAQGLPCFLSNDELSMESFEHVDPLLEVCLQKVKQALSQHEAVIDQITKLRRLERECQENSKPELSDGMELLKEYSEHLKFVLKDEVWSVKYQALKNKMEIYLSSDSEHSKIIRIFMELAEDNFMLKTKINS